MKAKAAIVTVFALVLAAALVCGEQHRLSEEAVAAEQIARSNPEAARRVITAELNQDGPDYLGPSIRQLRGLGTRRVDPRQGQLFGGT